MQKNNNSMIFLDFNGKNHIETLLYIRFRWLFGFLVEIITSRQQTKMVSDAKCNISKYIKNLLSSKS